MTYGEDANASIKGLRGNQNKQLQPCRMGQGAAGPRADPRESSREGPRALPYELLLLVAQRETKRQAELPKDKLSYYSLSSWCKARLRVLTLLLPHDFACKKQLGGSQHPPSLHCAVCLQATKEQTPKRLCPMNRLQHLPRCTRQARRGRSRGLHPEGKRAACAEGWHGTAQQDRGHPGPRSQAPEDRGKSSLTSPVILRASDSKTACPCLCTRRDPQGRGCV